MKAVEAFEILSIEKVFPLTEDAVKKAFRAKAKEAHPDVGGTEERMRKYIEARDYLMDNLGKINEVNQKKTEKESGKVRNEEQKIQAAERFAFSFRLANTREEKLRLIERFVQKYHEIDGDGDSWADLAEVFDRTFRGYDSRKFRW